MKTGFPRHLMMTYPVCQRKGFNGNSDMLETYVLALGDGADGNFNLGLSQNVGGGGHVDEEVCKITN